jgi:hypothetical protein
MALFLSGMDPNISSPDQAAGIVLKGDSMTQTYLTLKSIYCMKVQYVFTIKGLSI